MLTTISSDMEINKNFVEIVFVGIACVTSSSDLPTTSIISSQVITESSIILSRYLPFPQVEVLEFQIWPSSHAWSLFWFFHWHWHNYLFHFWSKLHFLLSNLFLHSWDIFFVYSAILADILKTLKFTSSVLFETHVLPDVPLRVLQLPLLLSKLTING